jgi:oligopeptide transport system permease protein
MTGGALSAAGSSGPWRAVSRRFLRNPVSRSALITLLAILLLVLLGPFLSAYDYDSADWENIGAPPSIDSGHWFGTDGLGRDLFARTLHGGRVSLLVGVVATLICIVIGTVYGAIAGYLGRTTDILMMRAVDMLYSVPFLFLVIVLMVVFGRNLILLFVAIGLVEWLNMARVVRGQTITVRHQEFIDAARCSGLSSAAIIRKHIIPNCTPEIIVYATLTIPQVIITESFLSFLGLGVQEPRTSWGVLIAEGTAEMETAPWLLLIPSAFLALTLFALNFVGDGLRDALDPKRD